MSIRGVRVCSYCDGEPYPRDERSDFVVSFCSCGFNLRTWWNASGNISKQIEQIPNDGFAVVHSETDEIIATGLYETLNKEALKNHIIDHGVECYLIPGGKRFEQIGNKYLSDYEEHAVAILKPDGTVEYTNPNQSGKQGNYGDSA